MNKVDQNQSIIIQALRAAGATVTSLADVGKGCPDLLVGWRGHNFLMEIKNLEGRGKQLTLPEKDWIRRWHGTVSIITDVEEAIDALSVFYKTNN